LTLKKRHVAGEIAEPCVHMLNDSPVRFQWPPKASPSSTACSSGKAVMK
jgi:hypothetical protein